MKKKAQKSKKMPYIEVSESKDYKIAYAGGVFGGLDPNGGRMIFFLDRVKPKMRNKPRGAMDIEKINRELQVEVHMSPPQFMSIAKWMMEHAQRFQKKVKEGKAGMIKEEGPDSSGTSYIG
jgi:hypothetical protein